MANKNKLVSINDGQYAIVPNQKGEYIDGYYYKGVIHSEKIAFSKIVGVLRTPDGVYAVCDRTRVFAPIIISIVVVAILLSIIPMLLQVTESEERKLSIQFSGECTLNDIGMVPINFVNGEYPVTIQLRTVENNSSLVAVEPDETITEMRLGFDVSDPIIDAQLAVITETGETYLYPIVIYTSFYEATEGEGVIE